MKTRTREVGWPGSGRLAWIALAAASLLTFGAPRALAVDPTSKCDRVVRAELAADKGAGWSNLIVRLDGGLTAGRRSAIESLGGQIEQAIPAIESVVLRMPTRKVGRLGSLQWVERVSHDFRVLKADDFTVNHTFAQWGWNPGGYDGGGINIAIVDSGVQPSKDLSGSSFSSRLIKHMDFSSKSLDQIGEMGMNDPCGHGTHVAGIAAGNSKSASGLNARKSFMGSAPKAGIVSVRVLERDGSGDVSNVLAGLQWVLDNKSAWNIRVVNLSLGHPVGESYVDDPLCRMVETLWKQGIVVVCAAGNMGRLYEQSKPEADNEGWGTAYGSIQVPGNSPYVITVGAMKRLTDNIRANDRVATYSSRGPSIFDYVLKPDLVAPGNKVVSIGPVAGYLFQNHRSTNMLDPSSYLYNASFAKPDDNGYFTLSGTSMAAPAVAGTVAQLLDKEPWLNPDTIKARLMITSDKWAYPIGPTDGAVPEGDACSFGAGFLNVMAALESKITTSGFALSPSLTLDDDGNLVLKLDEILYGTRAIWGTGIPDPRAVWGERAIWGSTSGSRAIWGLVGGRVADNRAIWGTTQQVQADRAVWGSGAPVCDLTSIAINGEN